MFTKIKDLKEAMREPGAHIVLIRAERQHGAAMIPWPHPRLNIPRKVIAVRSNDFLVETINSDGTVTDAYGPKFTGVKMHEDGSFTFELLGVLLTYRLTKVGE